LDAGSNAGGDTREHRIAGGDTREHRIAGGDTREHRIAGGDTRATEWIGRRSLPSSAALQIPISTCSLHGNEKRPLSHSPPPPGTAPAVVGIVGALREAPAIDRDCPCGRFANRPYEPNQNLGNEKVPLRNFSRSQIPQRYRLRNFQPRLNLGVKIRQAGGG